MEKIRIETDYMKLDQFLKLANLVGSGGEAKFLIKDGQIKVNDEIAYERGKKIKKGDTVSLGGGKAYTVI